MTTWPRDHRTRPRTASSNPGPIHAPSTTDHKNCRVWRWFWWHRRPAPLSTPPTDLWIINPNQLRLLLVPGELVTRGRLQVSGQSHNSSVYGPTWLPQASTTINPPFLPPAFYPGMLATTKMKPCIEKSAEPVQKQPESLIDLISATNILILAILLSTCCRTH